MASLRYTITLLVICVVLQLRNASADILDSTFSSNLNQHISNTVHLCREVECGKGTCKPSHDSVFGFECECDPGWKQAFNFLPCIIPNCTLNYSCGGSATPAENNRDHSSLFDPCHWVDCGVGVCNKTSALSYACECNDGYFNLLNVKAFPCLKQCTLGMDCGELGLNSNTTTPPASPSFSDSNNAFGGFIVGGGFDWLITIAALLAAMFLLK